MNNKGMWLRNVIAQEEISDQTELDEETMQPVREIACSPGLDKGSYCLRDVLGWN